MSDVEDLLNEIEGLQSGKEKKNKKKRKKEADEVEDFLKEFDSPEVKNNGVSSIVKCEFEGISKCFPVYLSGSFEEQGASRTGLEKPCENLKCVRCDFRVSHFENYEWDPGTDYLFLRSNMPDFERLKTKLQRKLGTRAYACQCYNVSICKLTDLRVILGTKWVCGKH